MPNLSERVTAAMDYVAASDDHELRPHYLHRVSEMLADIADLDKLSTAELAALAALLMPAHSRVLLGRVGATSEPDRNRVLRLVVPHSEPPAQLG